MQEELLSIDRLEDQLIDHPDATTKHDLNGDTLDETFQRKLNARAEQLASQGSQDPDDKGTLQRLINKTELKYTYRDYGSLENELNDWFVAHDFKVIDLDGLNARYTEGLQRFESQFQHIEDEVEIEYLKHCVESLTQDEICGSSLDTLIYYGFGKFKSCTGVCEQVHQIRDNVKVLYSLGVVEGVCHQINLFIDERINADDSGSDQLTDDTNYFKALTILYFMVNTFLQCSDSPTYLSFRTDMNDIDLMSSIVSFIQHWKVNPNGNYRIRHLIILLWKLILLEFGGSETLQSCDKFLIKYHNIKSKDNKLNKLTCSPLDYYTFRQDLVDKYPLFGELTSIKTDPYDFKQFGKTLDEINGNPRAPNPSSSSSSLREDYDFFMALNSQSSSLSNYIAHPRTNGVHTTQRQLPAQTVHISTPVPSPPSTPSDFMSGGEKIRKSYQINQSMPFIYPLSDEVEVPYAVKEADEILRDSIYDSYSNKRLWAERQKFMVQERGYLNNYEEEVSESQSDEFEYNMDDLLKKYPSNVLEIKSFMRVEKFYGKNLDKLSSLMEVLIGTIRSYKIEHNLHFIEDELNGETPYYANDKELMNNDKKTQIDKILIQQLEVLRTKEITAKASSGIICLLLKWFKINHVLKYYYLTTILFDSQVCTVAMDFLTETFNNPNNRETTNGHELENAYDSMIYQNQLTNPAIAIPMLNFFNQCLGNSKPHRFHLINKKKLTEFGTKLTENNVNKFVIDEVNENHCFIMINLVNIIHKVILKNHTQRILTVNELKPSEIFKMIVVNFDNPHLTIPILKILKQLIPYQGRKWKSLNMDLISMVYLNCRLSMRDTWLSGKDVENDFHNSFDQEISLRGLLQFYNMRKYPEKMRCLGYEVAPEFTSFPSDENFDYL
ncbi:Factor arrest protein 11 [Yamadazyma tenuis]|uniref:Factor arrest protein 11 n=1 Tax=Candida tenuis (strain ATCC 10573 / BCRC 21748 / CBS 615 / JCM 9827 / NBRC 10315 / NRRL Y-1498 / VKM Y-70) TaxID=590646 RepID=G3AXR3_CANTC|nr:uncharacterized protein CANTEDRAFT_133084 [Yamadazyma tenuis ATCC 10573]EGV65676.1 hypothetical protein CANTEDRAFT_133084 [Yamadazyma tenuis ATCC 10573]WEJ96010.1 Factor arrest protein 11 [Yamadazyma tenuis]